MFMNRRFELRPHRRLIIPSSQHAVKLGADILERYAHDKSAIYAPADQVDIEKFEHISLEDLDILCDIGALYEKYWGRT